MSGRAFGPSSSAIVAPALLGRAAELRAGFLAASPFPHVVIDGFLDDAVAHELVAQFPAFEDRNAVNEMGGVGRKAVVPGIEHLGPAFERVHRFFGSHEFLSWMSDVTGIADLRYDAENFGGGTHENLEGQDLLPHVDFNHHPTTGYHRRLNLIVYLNEGWQPEWGGSITVHTDPRDPQRDVTAAYAPTFNRCIIFETSERSWHSFDRIVLPEGEKHRSRKSLSIYLYTRERPHEQQHGDHITFYVPRPLPEHFHAGRTLTDADVEQLHGILAARDGLIAMHQQREAALTPAEQELQRVRIALAERAARTRLPLMGYVRQTAAPTGWYEDGWSSGTLEFSVEPERDVKSFMLRVTVPDAMADGTLLRVAVDGKELLARRVAPGAAQIACDCRIRAGSAARITIASSETVNYKALGRSQDERDLAFYLDSIVFEHTR